VNEFDKLAFNSGCNIIGRPPEVAEQNFHRVKQGMALSLKIIS
jgi:hypothetical protein